MSKIVTSYFRVPGPAPECDWSARYEDLEDSSPVGYGLTEQDAILDLTMNYDTPEEYDLEHLEGMLEDRERGA